MLIQLSLAEAKRQREKGPSHGPTDPKSTTSPLSSPELSPEPVLGKRKTRGSGAGNVSLDTAESSAISSSSSARFSNSRTIKQQLVEEIRVLEKQLASQPQLTVAEPKLLEWTNEIVRDGIRMRRQDMNESVREYWDLKTELAADEEQLRVEAKLLEDAQMNLGLAIAQQRLKQIIPVK
ncbi:hypothetical protein R3P38DRAFT_1465282 [Favolaschia claudopus]|uniref:BMERB domain-containing protein n=1 Tax=Favolaschia claudopus TaxID=2862362 RepID=A0AAW0DPW4_9AGAR